MSTEDPKPATAKIKIRWVWAHNLDSEFDLICRCVDRFPFATMDTEFPGVIHRPSKSGNHLTPDDHYAFLKLNVDSLHIIQFGLTLSDPHGDLPDLGSESGSEPNTRFVWEFNFKDFDIDGDLCATDSIELLKNTGINFGKNKINGIDSRDFGSQLMSSGLVLNDLVSWVTFHSAYDFGYLIKILTGLDLPTNLEEFVRLIRLYFGKNEFFDVKYMARFCDGLYGGLDRVAGALNVERDVGRCHQAGSDSLVTWKTFLRMREVYFGKDGGKRYAGVVFGLEYF